MDGDKKRIPGKVTLPAEVAEAMDKVLWYVWQDEIENFIADEPGPDEEHIFRHIAVVDGWFYGHEETAEELAGRHTNEGEVTEMIKKRVRSFRR
jgi:hypothetical protein